jgi:chemotaxis protein MotB
MKSRVWVLVVAVIFGFSMLTGCASSTKKKPTVNPFEEKNQTLSEKSIALENEIKTLKDDNAYLDGELRRLNDQLSSIEQDKDMEVAQLMKARKELERALAEELDAYKAKLEMTEQGLRITFLSEIFFNSGQAELKESAQETLSKVSEIITQKAGNSHLEITGHTDTDPIIHSGWQTNWELASARALSVLHYLIDTGGIDPTKISSISYGEFLPVADNSTDKGKSKNRRVELLIAPPRR